METKDTLSSCSYSDEQDMQKMLKRAKILKGSCLKGFSALKSNFTRKLKQCITKSEFERAFRHIFGEDVDTFTRTFSQNIDTLEQQLTKETILESNCQNAFRVLKTQFEKIFTFVLIKPSSLDGTYARKDFHAYTGMEPQLFKETILKNFDFIKNYMLKTIIHAQMIQQRLDDKEFHIQECIVQEVKASDAISEDKAQERCMTTEENVDMSKALDASVVDTESSVTESVEQDTSSRSRNDAHVDDADIIPIYDEEPMVDVHTTAEINIFAIGQQHTEQPEFNNKGEVDQNAEQCHDTCPLPAKLTDSQTTELSNQSLESKNICLKKTVAQFQKEFLRMEAHYVNLELKYQNQASKYGQHGQFSKVKSKEAKIKHDIDERGFAIATLKNELRKLTGNSVNTKFTKSSILGKLVLQPHRNQSVVRQPTAFKSERPRILKPRFASQVDVNNDLSKPVTTHYLPMERKYVVVKPPHVIASSESRNSSKNMPRFSSNDMVHNHCLKEAKKKHKKAIEIQDLVSCLLLDHKAQRMVANQNLEATLKHLGIGLLPRVVLQRQRLWKPTSKSFKTVGLRWVPTGKIFNSSTIKADSEPLNGSNVDITNQYECEQTLDVSAGTLNLSVAMTSDHKNSKLRIHDHSNELSSSKLVPKVVPSADTTTTSRQELELLFHHHITIMRQTLEESLTKFMAESTKRHEENSNIIKEIRASIDAAIRNQGASIKTLEIQIGQMSKVLQERGIEGLPGSIESNPMDHVKSISTTKADSSEIRQAQDVKILKAYDHTLPKKEEDLGSFTLPYFILIICFDKALVDIGASVSVMSFSTYTNLGPGILSHTTLTIELVDRTIKQPMGIAKNVLVRIGKFIFPIDFIILDIPEDEDVPLILDRPFLSTAHSKIDVYKRKITLRVREEKLVFKNKEDHEGKSPAEALIDIPIFVGKFSILTEIHSRGQVRANDGRMTLKEKTLHMAYRTPLDTTYGCVWTLSVFEWRVRFPSIYRLRISWVPIGIVVAVLKFSFHYRSSIVGYERVDIIIELIVKYKAEKVCHEAMVRMPLVDLKVFEDGLFRMCIDFRELSKIYLYSDCHQIRVHEDETPKTAFRMRYECYEFTVMPFGSTRGLRRSRVAFEDEFGAVEEREVSCEARQGQSRVKRELFRSCRNNMGNEPILALPKGSDNFIVMRGARVKMCDVRTLIMEEVHAMKYFIPLGSLGTRVDMSTAYHPYNDGQSECTFWMLENMFRACVRNLAEVRILTFCGMSFPTKIVIIRVFKVFSLEALNSRKCRSPVLWAEIRESNLIRPELVLETIDKVVLIKKKLKSARDRQKSYVDKRHEIRVDKTLRFVEEPVEIMDREVKKLKHMKRELVKVRWNSKCGPKFTWEHKDHMSINSIYHFEVYGHLILSMFEFVDEYSICSRVVIMEMYSVLHVMKIETIHERLKAAQDRWKSYTDNRRKPIEFEVGNYVMLKVSSSKDVLRFRNIGKLSIRFTRPFKILKSVGEVAYVLELPEEMKGIHNDFHVSHLRKFLADEMNVVTLDDIEIDLELTSQEEPKAILGRKTRQLRNKEIPFVKVQWRHCKGCSIRWDLEEMPGTLVTPNEPIDSLSIGDEHLNTILATESNEFIKSCIENLVPNPSESDGENGCDVHACFTTFSNEEINSIRIDQHHFNAESDLIESLLNHDSSIFSSSSKSNYLLDEFAGELTLLKSISPGMDETDCYPDNEIRLTKRLLYENSSPYPPEEFVSENSNVDIESFSISPIPVKDSDSYMEEIDLSFNPDDPMSPSIEDDEDDSEGDNIFLERLLHDDPIPLPDTLDFSYDVRVFLPFFTYLVTSSILHSFRNEDTIFDPGITINRFLFI
uniref:Tf2-1-like SH3-like domain-containing protein n=1 Tax=Tanacetum cinerariifolium TaxID=118510 RepID=A0A6L2JPH4_TANCI|nr:hypothetical protein [Tanacetum cinerariifolium]